MMSCKGSVALQCIHVFFGLQVFVIAATGNFIHKEKGSNCTYAVTIQTSCTKGAGTSDHVSIRFGDVKSNDILTRHLNTKHVRRVDPLDPQFLDDVPKIPFQPCVIDQFEVKGLCVKSPICYLYLKLGGNDDWRPGFAQVQMVDYGGSHLSSGYFYFRRYLPRHAWFGSDLCDTEVTPFGRKHMRKVFAKTSNQI